MSTPVVTAAAVSSDTPGKNHDTMDTMSATRSDASSERRNKRKKLGSGSAFGVPITVASNGASFPNMGSVLGPYFLLGTLGKGTFSSIHKCINMGYFADATDELTRHRSRIAAAKVELRDFSQSGVLDSEAAMLDFLHRSLPPGSVPHYLGYYKCDNKAQALVMEYLPGDDIHQLRESVMEGRSRRMAVEDAVFLTADVMLPLLRKLHEAGVVHRDVKPSNCVRSSTTEKEFCMVDFGLSKSVVVPEDSDIADKEHPWPGEWMRPMRCSSKGCLRKERSKAEFRGTSMYASPRIHQLRDYSPRDDMWSLMYVFCDLVSGGLPWMSHASNRDRAGCQRVKERVHGMAGKPDETEQLLMGDLFHLSKYKRSGPNHIVSDPLNAHKDEKKVALLRQSFAHLASLGFSDTPDYDLLQRNINGFLELPNTDPPMRRIEWIKVDFDTRLNRANVGFLEWEQADTRDPLRNEELEEAAKEREKPKGRFIPFLERLPLEVQYYVAQMRLNAGNDGVPDHIALNDWMKVVLFLLQKPWNYEDGPTRTSTDGHKRDRYLSLLRECQECAKKHRNFRSRAAHFESIIEEGSTSFKRRKVVIHNANGKQSNLSLILLSRIFIQLEEVMKKEEAKKPPPPMRLSFSS